MKKGKLKKLNIDFLHFEKEKRKLSLIKYMLIFILVFSIIFVFLSFTIKNGNLKELEKKLERTNNNITALKEDITEKEKIIKTYLKKRKKTVSILNSFICKKGYPLEDDIKFIKDKMSIITIYNFDFKEDSSIKIDIGSANFDNLISFKKYLEQRFTVKVKSDTKKENIYYQTLILKRKQ